MPQYNVTKYWEFLNTYLKLSNKKITLQSCSKQTKQNIISQYHTTNCLLRLLTLQIMSSLIFLTYLCETSGSVLLLAFGFTISNVEVKGKKHYLFKHLPIIIITCNRLGRFSHAEWMDLDIQRGAGHPTFNISWNPHVSLWVWDTNHLKYEEHARHNIKFKIWKISNLRHKWNPRNMQDTTTSNLRYWIYEIWDVNHFKSEKHSRHNHINSKIYKIPNLRHIYH